MSWMILMKKGKERSGRNLGGLGKTFYQVLEEGDKNLDNIASRPLFEVPGNIKIISSKGETVIH